MSAAATLTRRDAAVIEVRNLRVHFRSKERVVRAVDGISFDLNENEILGIVGETGSGKSVTARSLMGLLPMAPVAARAARRARRSAEPVGEPGARRATPPAGRGSTCCSCRRGSSGRFAARASP
jgi:ABC-type phosphonate transport system ATPase subunit